MSEIFSIEELDALGTVKLTPEQAIEKANNTIKKAVRACKEMSKSLAEATAALERLKQSYSNDENARARLILPPSKPIADTSAG